ncbi:hypothetical protein, partial [Klebsiella pneumoniae]
SLAQGTESLGCHFALSRNRPHDERHLLVSVVSVWLRRAGGDAGAMMLDAYRQILSETEPAVRTVMLEFLESVRIHYISS